MVTFSDFVVINYEQAIQQPKTLAWIGFGCVCSAIICSMIDARLEKNKKSNDNRTFSDEDH